MIELLNSGCSLEDVQYCQECWEECELCSCGEFSDLSNLPELFRDCEFTNIRQSHK